MCTKEQIQEAKQYLSEQGYGTGSNFTVNAVANLMAEWLAKKCNIPHVVGQSEQFVCLANGSCNEQYSSCNECPEWEANKKGKLIAYNEKVYAMYEVRVWRMTRCYQLAVAPKMIK